MKSLPLPTPGVTLYRRYDMQYEREELGLVVNVRIQRHEDGSLHSWSAMIAGQDGIQPLGHLDFASDIHGWHPVEWIREGYSVRPAREDEEAGRLPAEFAAVRAVAPESETSLEDTPALATPVLGTDVPVYAETDLKEDLVALCEEHGLSIRGSKADIVARLDEHFGVEKG